MGWHLCSGSDSDSLEASPLCRDIHWLGCGSPVADDKPNRNSVESFWVNSADNSDKLVNARTSSFTGVVASNNIKAKNMHGDQRSSLQRVLCARFITTALLCFHCHLSNLMYCNALGWRFSFYYTVLLCVHGQGQIRKNVDLFHSRQTENKKRIKEKVMSTLPRILSWAGVCALNVTELQHH